MFSLEIVCLVALLLALVELTPIAAPVLFCVAVLFALDRMVSW